MAFPMILTKSGLSLFLDAIANKRQVKITDFRVSSKFAEANSGRTALSEEKEKFSVVQVFRESETRISLTARIESQQQSPYSILEVGFFAEIGTDLEPKQVLIAIASSPEPLAIANPKQPIFVRFALDVIELANGEVTITGAGTDLNLTVSKELIELTTVIIKLQSEITDLKNQLVLKGVI